MSGESLLVILLVGLIAGWLAGQIVKGTGFGLVADLCIGIIGAFIGDWLLPRLGIHLGTGILAAIIAATIGAVLLLVILTEPAEGNAFRLAPDLWPFNPSTNIIDRDLARSIRAWALTEMTEAELNSYSQRQLLRMYIDRSIKPAIDKVLKRQRTPEEAEASARRVVLDQSPPADKAETLLWEALHG